ncbi:rod shape-determining protein MreC [Patescibacteria group bacterium]|nr:rod shape-determining protein MreC [Patescibacteria group bacterium]
MKKALFGIFLIALFLFLFFSQKSHDFFAKITLGASRPFFQKGDDLKNWLDLKQQSFKEKEALFQENKDLKEKINELETQILSCHVLDQENKDLKNALSLNKQNEFIVSFIISRPPQAPYDIFILDSGSDDGIENGMMVTAYGEIMVGYIEEVFSKTSRVKLISFPKNETNAFTLSSSTPVMLIGKGGGNMEINLPRGVEINVGEKIVTNSSDPLILGIVDVIQASETDPFQKILLRIPANIYELKYVMVKK